MKEFNSWVFKENEVKTHNQKILKERTFYIGILIFLVGAALEILEFDYAAFPIGIGCVVMMVGRAINSGKTPSVGHRPLTLKLTRDAVWLGNEKLEIRDRSDVQVKIRGHKGEPAGNERKHNGNENQMWITTAFGVSEIKFVLDSEDHKDKLVAFCEEHEFEIL